MAPVLRRAALVAAALLLFATPAWAAGSLRARLTKALAAPHVSRALTGAVAVDLRTGRVVYARNASLSLEPASTEKLALTFAALDRPGPRSGSRPRSSASVRSTGRCGAATSSSADRVTRPSRRSA